MTAQPNIGEPVPRFTLTVEGQPLTSADLIGQAYVLFFYPKDDTPGCTSEAKAFSDLLPKFQSANTRVIGASKDSQVSHDKFKAKHGLTIELATDPEGQVIEAFGSWVEKSMYGRVYMGIDRSTFLVDHAGLLRRLWRKVKIAGHAADVLAAAESLRS